MKGVWTVAVLGSVGSSTLCLLLLWMSLRGYAGCNTQTRRSKSPRVSEASEEGEGGGWGIKWKEGRKVSGRTSTCD